MNLENLKTVEIFGNRTIGICQNLYSKNISNSIIDIRYVSGKIDKLQEDSLNCLPQIEILMITKTNLMTIQVGVFNLLNNLKYINLSCNKLTTIPMNLFDNLKNLAVILLNNNEIKNIQDKTFTLPGIESIKLLNLSHNEINIKSDTFDGVKCDQLDLSYNKISHIENNAFEDTNIKQLYLHNNFEISVINPAWRIPKFTIVQMYEDYVVEFYPSRG
ncbi:leucine-rich repeat-containing protein let-4-like [Aphidius gifuensis]|uniref:leucine-rich repeat-containing protein let-4-like n=1 Tax=Aphidius gifuensis TaxID=684658 RepID=UPI001CDD0541|nr:leucine-rich repeat-containing protein let-4-like [Aphidius gifuensis]